MYLCLSVDYASQVFLKPEQLISHIGDSLNASHSYAVQVDFEAQLFDIFLQRYLPKSIKQDLQPLMIAGLVFFYLVAGDGFEPSTFGL